MSSEHPTAFDQDNPRILVADASKVTRRMIERLVCEALPEAEVITVDSGAEALDQLHDEVVDLVTTSLSLPDMDGMSLAKQIRAESPQRYIPIIAVSGEVQDRLVQRTISEDITDYFDKSQGFPALAAFIRGYVKPDADVKGHILYVEDSRVVALATKRMMMKHGLEVTHVVSVEEALELLGTNLTEQSKAGFDLALTDVYLKGGLTGKEFVEQVRGELNLNRRQLPVVVMTGDDNRSNQATLLRGGANDLVEKPIDEKLLVNKLRFQLQVTQGID